MRQQRPAQAGVTLIEMLVALAISAMIGVAGLILLESVSRTEAGVAGRLERLKLQNRAFHLLARDVEQAHMATLGRALELRVAGQSVVWHASESGVVRRLNFADRPRFEQHLLDDPATLTYQDDRAVILTLPNSDVWRWIPLPVGHQP